jgi:hypothetical protein
MGDFAGHPFRGNQYTVGQEVAFKHPQGGDAKGTVLGHAGGVVRIEQRGTGSVHYIEEAGVQALQPTGVTVSRGDYKDAETRAKARIMAIKAEERKLLSVNNGSERAVRAAALARERRGLEEKFPTRHRAITPMSQDRAFQAARAKGMTEVEARIKARETLGWKPAQAGSALSQYGRNGSKLPKGMGG